MKVTEVKISFPSKRSQSDHPKLLAFVSIILDYELAIHDIKIINGENGIFVAFPSKEVHIICPSCSEKTPLRLLDCIQCGKEIKETEIGSAVSWPHYSDIVHPVSNRLRTTIQNMIILEYNRQINPQKNTLETDNSFSSGIF